MQVRIPDDLIDRIDELRGLVPRETYVRSILSEKVEELEKALKPTPKRRVKR
jgi:predicted DNA-binding protein